MRGRTEAAIDSSTGKPKITPPSLVRRSTGNNVSFSGVIDDATRPTSYSANNNNNKSQTFTSHLQRPSHISLERVISSQFENEATTHILAALEMEDAEATATTATTSSIGNKQLSLAGEGITAEDGMEDYSEDEDDHLDTAQLGGSGNRGRTWSTDSFIKRIQEHENLQQYQNTMNTTPPPPPPKTLHRPRQLSNRGISAGMLPSVPSGSALADSAEECDALFDAVNKASGGRRTKSMDLTIDVGGDTASIKNNEDGDLDLDSSQHGNNPERHLSDIKEEEEDDSSNYQGGENPMHTTNATTNMNNMAERLRALQKRSTGFRRSMSTKSLDSSEVAAGGLGAEAKTSGDKLIDALNSVSQSEKGRGFIGKIHYEYTNLIAPKIPTFQANASHTLFFAIVPCMAVAALLYYMLDNPMAGDSGTSVSWWILFLGVRHLIIFEFTRVGEVFWVEIMALRSSLFNRALGPYVALAFIQSKGWPYICTFYPVLNFCFLYGSGQFPKHWLYWQPFLGLFNASNPVNGITEAEIYLRLLISLMFVGVVVSLKRLALAIYLGRRTVAHFGQELEKLMAKMILIGEVANLAKDIESKQNRFLGLGPLTPLNEDDDEKLVRFRNFVANDDSSYESPNKPRDRKVLNEKGTSPGSADKSPSDSVSPPGSPDHRHHPSSDSSRAAAESERKAMTSSSTNSKLMYLLEEWEEPEMSLEQNVRLEFSSCAVAILPNPL